MAPLNSGALNPKPAEAGEVIAHGNATAVRRVTFREDAKIENRRSGVVYVFDADLAAHYVQAGKADYADAAPEPVMDRSMGGPSVNRAMRGRKSTE